VSMVDEHVADTATIEPQMSVQYCLLKLCQRWQDAGYNPGYDIELAKASGCESSGNEAGQEGPATRDGP